MKSSYTFLYVMLLALVVGCRTESRSPKDSDPSLETETQAEAIASDEEETPEIDLGGLMNVMGGLMTGNVATDSAGQGLFTPEGQLNVDF